MLFSDRPQARLNDSTFTFKQMSHSAVTALCRAMKLACELYPSRDIAVCLDPYCGLGFLLWCLTGYVEGKIRTSARLQKNQSKSNKCHSGEPARPINQSENGTRGRLPSAGKQMLDAIILTNHSRRSHVNKKKLIRNRNRAGAKRRKRLHVAIDCTKMKAKVLSDQLQENWPFQ